jgi:hypothetical protein
MHVYRWLLKHERTLSNEITPPRADCATFIKTVHKLASQICRQYPSPQISPEVRRNFILEFEVLNRDLDRTEIHVSRGQSSNEAENVH